MPPYALQVRASLEKVTQLGPMEPEQFRWDIIPKCGSCGEVGVNPLWVSSTQEEEVAGGRGTANVVGKCKACRQQYSVSVLNDKLATYDVADSGNFKTIVVFECRGVELHAYTPGGGWQCKGWVPASEENGGEDKLTGTDFPDVDLSDDWAEYDEKSDESVEIMEMATQFVAA
eukprot:m.79034 g.79034  ORF g.79034 m.79034 type:complete len:173 (-) comp19258_c1_seq1:2361-2879(-)